MATRTKCVTVHMRAGKKTKMVTFSNFVAGIYYLIFVGDEMFSHRI